MRRVFAAVLGSALSVAVATPSWADAAQFRLPNGGGHGGVGQNRGPMGGQRGQGGPHVGGGNPFRRGPGLAGGDGYRHRGYGAAIGAGVAGLAAGAIVGGALANQGGYYNGYGYDQGYGYGAPGYGAPVYAGPTDAQPGVDDQVEPASGDAESYCAQRYRSYDPDSQTYMGYDGERHPCP